MPPFRLSVTSTWPELQPAPAAGFDFCFFDLDTGVEGHLQESIEAYSVTDYYHHGQKPESNEKMPAYHIASSTKTIADYINENKIIETPFNKDEPGAPVFDFPTPPGWALAGEQTPEWAYGAIVYQNPVNPEDPPFVLAIISKLTGDVDPANCRRGPPEGCAVARRRSSTHRANPQPRRTAPGC